MRRAASREYGKAGKTARVSWPGKFKKPSSSLRLLPASSITITRLPFEGAGRSTRAGRTILGSGRAGSSGTAVGASGAMAGGGSPLAAGLVSPEGLPGTSGEALPEGEFSTDGEAAGCTAAGTEGRCGTGSPGCGRDSGAGGTSLSTTRIVGEGRSAGRRWARSPRNKSAITNEAKTATADIRAARRPSAAPRRGFEGVLRGCRDPAPPDFVAAADFGAADFGAAALGAADFGAALFWAGAAVREPYGLADLAPGVFGAADFGAADFGAAFFCAGGFPAPDAEDVFFLADAAGAGPFFLPLSVSFTDTEEYPSRAGTSTQHKKGGPRKTRHNQPQTAI